MRIYIASPYTLGNQADNVRRQVLLASRLIDMGHYPHIPLLNHFQHLITPYPESVWLEQDRAWLEVCDCLVRLPGESKGADQESKWAIELGIPVFEGEESLIKFLTSSEKEVKIYPKRFKECFEKERGEK